MVVAPPEELPTCLVTLGFFPDIELVLGPTEAVEDCPFVLPTCERFLEAVGVRLFEVPSAIKLPDDDELMSPSW